MNYRIESNPILTSTEQKRTSPKHAQPDTPPKQFDPPHLIKTKFNLVRRISKPKSGQTFAFGKVVKFNMPGIHIIPSIGTMNNIQRVTIDTLIKYEYNLPT